jgi:hypothetical protein
MENRHGSRPEGILSIPAKLIQAGDVLADALINKAQGHVLADLS